MNLKNRNFLKILDFSSNEVSYLLKLSKKLKEMKKAGKSHKLLTDKNIILLFQKDSTRTRSAFEIAGYDLGMGVTYFGPSGSQFAKKESVVDSAKVLGGLYDGIQFRGFKDSDVEDLGKYAGVPVWNGLTDGWHPTQMLADYLTIMEIKPELKGLKFVYFGDARFNMNNSYMIMAAKMGVHYVACSPKKYWPSKEILKMAEDIAKETGGSITLTEDYKTASKDADVITTDVWVSMGESDDAWEERIGDFINYQVNMDKMKIAKKDAIFLHCLPAFHDDKTTISAEKMAKFSKKFPDLKNGFEVSDEVFKSNQSHVFTEAENRMHTIKAVVLATMAGDVIKVD